jgi:hypothetical protein
MARERKIEESGLGRTNLRTTQFHDLVPRILDEAARLPVTPLPAGVRMRSIDTGEVAYRLAGLAVAGPTDRVPELGGREGNPVAYGLVARVSRPR